jgi:hypothetical protein
VGLTKTPSFTTLSSTDLSPVSSTVLEDAPRPRFVAGSGMELMGTKTRAAVSRGDVMHFDDSPLKRRNSLTSNGAATDDMASIEASESVLIPADYFRSQYDPQAQGQGVLKKKAEKRSERRVKIVFSEDP